MSSRRFELGGLDGTNPLGFLAAVGTLVTVADQGAKDARLRWRRAHTWVPVLEGVAAPDERSLAEVIAEGLRGNPVAPDAERERDRAEKAKRAAKTGIKKKREEIRKRRLTRSERREVEERELLPLELDYDDKRGQWLEVLRRAVPRPELALGTRIDCTPDEYRDHAHRLLSDAGVGRRDGLDMLAAFGSDGCRRRNSDTIEATPFCFISGSGHQEFLQTARALMDKVSAERVYLALFGPWWYRDEKFSMRWDPVEDRRYALLDRDPSGERARTVWMANLLAYRSLVLFPTAPTPRGLAAVGWQTDGSGRDTRRFLTWPLWEHAASLDLVRSLLALRELAEPQPDCLVLRARGIAAAYRAERIEVGSGSNRKINFSPAWAICSFGAHAGSGGGWGREEAEGSGWEWFGSSDEA